METTMTTNQYPSDPCPHCGCPYPNDHTADCPVTGETVDLQRRVEALEHNVAVLTNSLTGTIIQSRNLAGLIGDIGRIMGNQPPMHVKLEGRKE